MTIMFTMIVGWLSGTMVIKNARLKSKNKRRTFTYCLAPWSCNGLVYVRREEETVDVTDSCFLIIWYKNYHLRVSFGLTWPKSNKMVDFIYQLVNFLGWLKETPEHLKTQEICNEAVQMEPCTMTFVPDHFKTHDMCNKAVCMEPLLLKHVPDHLKTH